MTGSSTLAERIGFELEWRFATLSRFLGRKSGDFGEMRKQRIMTLEKVDRLRAEMMRFEPMVRFAPHLWWSGARFQGV